MFLEVLRQYLAFFPQFLAMAWALWFALFSWILAFQWEVRRLWLWHAGWVLWWLSFAYIAAQNWHGTQDIWTSGWMLDELYHYVFGMALALNIIYRYKRKPGNRSHPISGSRHLWFSVRINGLVFLLGYLWEIGFEYSWDNYFQINFFPWLGKAQKDQIDTLLDLALNPLGSLTAIEIFCRLERKFFNWLHEQKFEDAEIEEILDELQLHLTEAERLNRLISAQKKIFVKERLKNMLTRFRRISEDASEDK